MRLNGKWKNAKRVSHNAVFGVAKPHSYRQPPQPPQPPPTPPQLQKDGFRPFDRAFIIDDSFQENTKFFPNQMEINEQSVWLLILLWIPYTSAAASNSTAEHPQIVSWRCGTFLLEVLLPSSI